MPDQRDVRIAWAAAFVNDTGDWVLAVGLPVFVFVETGSGATTALLFVTGLLIDRMSLRPLVNAQALVYVVSGLIALWLFTVRRRPPGR